MAFKPDEALGLLLEAVRLDANFADAHASLAEMYVIREDYQAAWRHARAAEENGALPRRRNAHAPRRRGGRLMFPQRPRHQSQSADQQNQHHQRVE